MRTRLKLTQEERAEMEAEGNVFESRAQATEIVAPKIVAPTPLEAEPLTTAIGDLALPQHEVQQKILLELQAIRKIIWEWVSGQS